MRPDGCIDADHDGTLRVLTLCSGVECFGLALEQAGMTVVAACEIDDKAAGVIRYHYPTRPIYTDMRTLDAARLAADGIIRWCAACARWHGIDLVMAGWPCQDLSVAGKRAGLAGARSGLFFDVVRIVEDVDATWLIGENVPGLLSSVCACIGDGTCEREFVDSPDRCGRAVGSCPGKLHTVSGGACRDADGTIGKCIAVHGGAMGAVLGTLGELGMDVAYRVLDAQHFGLAQRRKRVFVVGHLGDDGRAPAAVLLEPEGRRGNPATGEPARQDVAGGVESGAGDAGAENGVAAWQCHGGNVGPAGTLRAGNGALTGGVPFVTHEVVSTLQAGGGERGYRVDAEAAGGGSSSSQRQVVSTLTSSHDGADDNDAQAGHIVVAS